MWDEKNNLGGSICNIDLNVFLTFFSPDDDADQHRNADVFDLVTNKYSPKVDVNS